ncbi:DUF4382 domain-containing protein [Thalassotalea sediminis]|uniref:DUF4382 domain-containing protein n=1 Tax=Thalassotalea sediminis TaxID=1759089 RepID=UPI002572EC91|nr:DUF4382 domain-containing protein [Thalassotalea sediminis]
MISKKALFSFVSACVFLAACGGSSSSSDGSTNVIIDSQATTTFSLGVSDAPVDDAVIVAIEIGSIKLINTDETNGKQEVMIDQFTNDMGEVVDSIQVNLLDHQGTSQLKIIDETQNVTLNVGEYTMELNVIDEGSYVMLDNDATEYAIKVPSSRLRLGAFMVTENAQQQGEVPAYTIEFDLRQSLVQRGNDPAKNGFIIKPHGVRIEGATGSISGLISAENTNLGACTVYLYEAAPTELGDMFDIEDTTFAGEVPTATAPIATAKVNDDSTYSIGFVAEGNYTVALFCGVEIDDNVQYDGLVIPSPEGNMETVDVVVGQETTVNF